MGHFECDGDERDVPPAVLARAEVGRLNLGRFFTATSFNQDVSTWDTSKVRRSDAVYVATHLVRDAELVPEDRLYRFCAASSFNQDLSRWDMSSVTDLSKM